MNNKQEQSKHKDTWDKLDILGKFLSAVVLVVIAGVIKYGADSIASSLQKGDFVRELITDLASDKADKARRDIALIALNHTLSKPEDHSLVAGIAKRILVTLPESDRTTVGEVAFMILKQRDEKAARELQREAEEWVEARNSQDNKSNPTDPKEAQASAMQAPPPPAFVVSIFPSVVYIQYRQQDTKELASELRKELEQNKLKAPGVELIEAEYANSIRYFHAEDQPAAAQVATIANAFLKAKKLNASFKLEFVQSSKFRSPKGQVEIWMNLSR